MISPKAAMNRKLFLAPLLLPFVLVVGCSVNNGGEPRPAQGGTTAAPTAPAVAAPTTPGAPVPSEDSAGPPMVVAVRGPGAVAASQTIDLEIVIDRRGASTFAVEVSVATPAGARMVGGDARTVVPAGTGQATVHVKLALDSIPADDLVVTAKAGDGKSWGATSEARYTFGRGDAKLPQPSRTGGGTTLPGGRNLGAPVKAH